MTAIPPPVPPEIVRRFAEEFFLTDEPGVWQLQAAEESLAAVYGDIVEAARRDALVGAMEGNALARAVGWDDGYLQGRRDALTEAAEQIARTVEPNPISDTGWSAAVLSAARIVTDLRDATAPPRAPTASVSDQGADPRTPTTPGAVSGHSGPREEDAETFTVSEIRAAFAAASPDDWGVPCHYETTMLLALRGER